MGNACVCVRRLWLTAGTGTVWAAAVAAGSRKNTAGVLIKVSHFPPPRSEGHLHSGFARGNADTSTMKAGASVLVRACLCERACECIGRYRPRRHESHQAAEVGVETLRGSDGEAEKTLMFQRGIFKVDYWPGLDGVQPKMRNIFVQLKCGALSKREHALVVHSAVSVRSVISVVEEGRKVNLWLRVFAVQTICWIEQNRNGFTIWLSIAEKIPQPMLAVR